MRSGLERHQALAAVSILTTVAVGHILVGCETGGEQGVSSQPQAAPVEIAIVSQRDLPIEITAIGTVEATNTVAVLPQVGGRITKVEFEEGAFVERGDPLFTLDTRPYNASLAAAQAELARSQAAAAQAKAETERYEALAREGLASDQEMMQRRAELAASRAAMQAARAAISSASLNVQFATLRSPIDGRTGALLVTVGNVVQPGGSDPLVVIRSLAPVKVSFNVPPNLLPRLRADGGVLPLDVRATTRGQKPFTATGQLTFVDNAVNAQTGSLTLKAIFANANESLWPGDFVDVVLVLGNDEQVVVAPEKAIAEGQQGPYAFIVDANDVARLRPVSIQRRTDEYVVVERGLKAGDRVVVNGMLRLRDGTPVAPKTTESSSTATPSASSAENRTAASASATGNVISSQTPDETQ